MKSLYLIFFFISSYLTFAQVAIGTKNPNPHSQLDIRANNKGLLIPRVALQNLTSPRPISDNTDELPESLLVFNTNPTTDLIKGYYFWNGEEWNKLATQIIGDVGGGDARGDLYGTYPNPNVIKLRGRYIDPTPPVAGQVLQYDGKNWIPVNMPSSSAGGDLYGTYPNPNVIKLRGINIDPKPPVAGQVLQYDGKNWVPVNMPSSSAGGDLYGTYPNPNVIKLRGINIDPKPPVTGQVLQYDGKNWVPVNMPSSSAGGDLYGTYPNPNVIKLRGINIDPKPPVAGQVLQYDGKNWIPVNMPSSSINRISAGKAIIPPHGHSIGGTIISDWSNFTNTSYNTADWKIFSKTSTPGTAFIDNVISPPKMVLVYEYTGIPFELDKLTPFLTIGNNTSFPDTFVATFIKLENVAGRTRLKVAVSRTDRIGLSDAAWKGTFQLNILLVN